MIDTVKVEPVPDRMRHLAIDERGYPVPWFVMWIDGKPEFRIADQSKWRDAIRYKLCWVCGQGLGRYMTFVIGPMCGINQTTAEPPCHRECAQYSARNCPFLSKPQMVRRENNMPEEADKAAIPGHAIMRNPGATLLWTTRGYSMFDDGRGKPLIRIGEPTSMEWYANGRMATRAEVAHSVDTGLPILMGMAEQQKGAVDELIRRKAWLEANYPKD